VARSTNDHTVGLVVDAGPQIGYGHAVRCLRLARALRGNVAVYPQSPECSAFFEREGYRDATGRRFPSLVVTDLREPHGISAKIRAQGSVHVSIHDLGLAQCTSDVAIDGSIVQLLPFSQNKHRALFLGPDYTIARPPVDRTAARDTVLVTLGGGASAQTASRIVQNLEPLGLRTICTGGFGTKDSAAFTNQAPDFSTTLTDSALEEAMSRCLFAISASGTALYDLLASGIPTIAVALDPLQLRTADAFQEVGAAVSAGLLDRLSPSALLTRCHELLGNQSLTSRMIAAGRRVVDGKGLERVVGILDQLRRDLWPMKHSGTFSIG
jgi:spore coat polysaccharide biosynthesis predicted glycosyltransferase SpsG